MEALDGLAASDPQAIRSRLDLQRIHKVMGTRTIVSQALRAMTLKRLNTTPLKVLEIGAGDGTVMLGVAEALSPGWPQVELTLLDRQPLVSDATIAQYAKLGWTVRSVASDALDWAIHANHPHRAGNQTKSWDLIVANLFLHHFEGEPLAVLLRAIHNRSVRFLACEPRRSPLALTASHLVGALGANGVTRKDAVVSVRAGFCNREISVLWPEKGFEWQTWEYAAGPFSHCFRAEHLGRH